MSKFLTAPQWYDAGGGLNKSLDVNCNGSDTATAFGEGANSREGGVSVGYRASSAGGLPSVAIGKDAEANYGGGNCIAIGWGAACVQPPKPSRKIQFLSRGISAVRTSEVGFGPGSLLDLIYPINSIYISVSSTDPRDIFGGTWEAFATGRTLVGVDPGDTDFNAANKPGGEKTVTLTTEQMPSHTHTLKRNTIDGHPYTGYVFEETSGPYESASTTFAGGSQPHNNMPPYITVYMWRRTA